MGNSASSEQMSKDKDSDKIVDENGKDKDKNDKDTKDTEDVKNVKNSDKEKVKQDENHKTNDKTKDQDNKPGAVPYSEESVPKDDNTTIEKDKAESQPDENEEEKDNSDNADHSCQNECQSSTEGVETKKKAEEEKRLKEEANLTKEKAEKAEQEKKAKESGNNQDKDEDKDQSKDKEKEKEDESDAENKDEKGDGKVDEEQTSEKEKDDTTEKGDDKPVAKKKEKEVEKDEENAEDKSKSHEKEKETEKDGDKKEAGKRKSVSNTAKKKQKQILQMPSAGSECDDASRSTGKERDMELKLGKSPNTDATAQDDSSGRDFSCGSDLAAVGDISSAPLDEMVIPSENSSSFGQSLRGDKDNKDKRFRALGVAESSGDAIVQPQMQQQIEDADNNDNNNDETADKNDKPDESSKSENENKDENNSGNDNDKDKRQDKKKKNDSAPKAESKDENDSKEEKDDKGVLLNPFNSASGSTALPTTQDISISHDVGACKPEQSQSFLTNTFNIRKKRSQQKQQQQVFQPSHQPQHQHGGYQQLQYAQINKEQEQTISVQFLIEATETALEMLTAYSDSLVTLLLVGNDSEDKKGKNKKNKSGNSEEKNDEDEKDEKNIKLNKFEKKVQSCNIKAITGLKLFETQTEAFLEKSEQRGMSKDIGMKNAKSRINKHLEDTENRLKQSGYPDEVIAYVLDRISPFIKGMTSVANGNELPALKTLKRTKVDEKQANSIIAKVLGKLNHDVPDMVSNVRKNYQDISMQHKMNALSVNDEDNNKNKSRGFSKDEANDIYRDIHKPLVYSKGAQQSLIDARKDCDKAREALYNEDPDLGLDDD